MLVAQCNSEEQRDITAFFGVANASTPTLDIATAVPCSLLLSDDIESQAPRATIGAVYLEDIKEKIFKAQSAQDTSLSTAMDVDINNADVERAIASMAVADNDEIEAAKNINFILEVRAFVFQPAMLLAFTEGLLLLFR